MLSLLPALPNSILESSMELNGIESNRIESNRQYKSINCMPNTTTAPYGGRMRRPATLPEFTGQKIMQSSRPYLTAAQCK
ncbi:hypothetical protein T07_11929 [Trichinella nelsoni]|uniref:Uncharacterized protein n=1 Tax=Trichinella nelsoni TaxID=6336 RepID=A0A0V0SK07_9BILA|nr:hypothetical protein T07_11929 [Trichinella nelsoni]